MNVYRSALLLPLVPTSVTTVMSTVPAAVSAGVKTLICDGLRTLKQPVVEEGHGYVLLAGTSTVPTPPLPVKTTSVVAKPVPLKLVPPIVTTLPPFSAPLRCEMVVTVGNVAP